MPSKVIITHFSPRLAARAKMSLSRAQNIFMPANINSIVILKSAMEKARNCMFLYVIFSPLQFIITSTTMLNDYIKRKGAPLG